MRSGTGVVVLPVVGPAALVGGGDSNFGGVTSPPGGGGLGGKPLDFPLFLAVGW